MKKILALLLSAVLVLSITGCSFIPGVRAGGNTFRVGYAKAEIMPDADLDGDGAVDPIALGGYGNTDLRKADYSLSEEWDTI